MRNNYYKNQKLSPVTLAIVASATGVLDYLITQRRILSNNVRRKGICNVGEGCVFGSSSISELCP